MDNSKIIEALNKPTPKDRIQFRIGFKNRAGDKACMLAYVDARYVMDRLDEAVGKDNWSAFYELNGQTMFCTIEVVWSDGKITKKTDCGIETEVDAEKCQSSDAFKRAAVHYGIGRDLYSMKQHWADLNDRGYVERDWKPEGWGNMGFGESTPVSTTTNQDTSPQPPHSSDQSKAQQIADRLADTAKKQQSEAQNTPPVEEKPLIDDNVSLRKDTPPEDEIVWVNNLTKVAESAKAVLLLPPEFQGDPKDSNLTRPYWMPLSKIDQMVGMNNGKFNVSVHRWIAEQTLPNGQPKWKIDETPF